MEGMQKVANRITSGLVLAALIIGAALLMRIDTPFRVLGYPGIAILCFLAATAGGVWLLANIYMHRFLRAWRQREKGRQYRARLIAYADDFVIVSRGQAAAALAWTRDVMTRIGLSLNDAKTSIRNARTETFDFLGYTLGSAVAPVDGHWYLAARPSKKSLQRVKGTVRGVLASGNQQPWPQVVADLNRRLRGWANYFNYGSCAQAYDAVDHYVTAAVRQFLRRRHKVPTRGTRQFAAVYSEWGVLSLGMLRRSSPA
jgi:RNA-directed DNA polymerase